MAVKALVLGRRVGDRALVVRAAWTARGADGRLQSSRDYDRRRAAAPWRGWYGTARWRSLRLVQLANEPLCAMCGREGVATPATVCDHVDPHRGDGAKFWAGPFQSLCAEHHSGDKQREEAMS